MRTKGRVSERLGYLKSRTIGSNERSLTGLLPTIWGPTRVFSPLQMALQINVAFTGVLKRIPILNIFELPIWVFPKIMVPPNHPSLIVFSIMFTIHFGGKIPLFLVQQPISFTRKKTRASEFFAKPRRGGDLRGLIDYVFLLDRRGAKTMCNVYTHITRPASQGKMLGA